MYILATPSLEALNTYKIVFLFLAQPTNAFLGKAWCVLTGLETLLALDWWYLIMGYVARGPLGI